MRGFNVGLYAGIIAWYAYRRWGVPKEGATMGSSVSWLVGEKVMPLSQQEFIEKVSILTLAFGVAIVSAAVIAAFIAPLIGIFVTGTVAFILTSAVAMIGGAIASMIVHVAGEKTVQDAIYKDGGLMAALKAPKMIDAHITSASKEVINMIKGLLGSAGRWGMSWIEGHRWWIGGKSWMAANRARSSVRTAMSTDYQKSDFAYKPSLSGTGGAAGMNFNLDWAPGVSANASSSTSGGSNILTSILNTVMSSASANQAQTSNAQGAFVGSSSIGRGQYHPRVYKPSATWGRTSHAAKAGSLGKYKASKMAGSRKDWFFIIHHTGAGTPVEGSRYAKDHPGEYDVQYLLTIMKKRNMAVQWFIDRNGVIWQILDEGQRGVHVGAGGGTTLDSEWDPWAMRSDPTLTTGRKRTRIGNSNSEGVEIAAKGDSDILPIQVQACLGLIRSLGYPVSRVFGHGELRGHKSRSEGVTIIEAFRGKGTFRKHGTSSSGQWQDKLDKYSQGFLPGSAAWSQAQRWNALGGVQPFQPTGGATGTGPDFSHVQGLGQQIRYDAFGRASGGQSQHLGRNVHGWTSIPKATVPPSALNVPGGGGGQVIINNITNSSDAGTQQFALTIDANEYNQFGGPLAPLSGQGDYDTSLGFAYYGTITEHTSTVFRVGVLCCGCPGRRVLHSVTD